MFTFIINRAELNMKCLLIYILNFGGRVAANHICHFNFGNI